MESSGQQFQSMVHAVKLRFTVYMVTDRNGGGLYYPTDLDSKTEEPVVNTLWYKHLEAYIQQADHLDEYQDESKDVGIFCFNEEVVKQAAHLNGAGGPSRVDVRLPSIGVYDLVYVWRSFGRQWLNGLLFPAIALLTMPYIMWLTWRTCWQQIRNLMFACSMWKDLYKTLGTLLFSSWNKGSCAWRMWEPPDLYYATSRYWGKCTCGQCNLRPVTV